MKNKNVFGFTLVELLVVIAIIGILSTVAVVNLQSARTKAKIAAIQAASRSVYDAASYCINVQENISYNGTNPCVGFSAPQPSPVTAGTAMCTNVNWPQFSDVALALYCNSDVGANAFRIVLQGGAVNGFPYNLIICDYNTGGPNDNKCITQ
ncbi:type II secretion system GspH family protein [Patescibacteria group bacterium]|nr:type II secretion system GspH family protein [Patescibacteria group bacterium]